MVMRKASPVLLIRKLLVISVRLIFRNAPLVNAGSGFGKIALESFPWRVLSAVLKPQSNMDSARLAMHL